jgi:hypothetical protein
MAFSTFSTFNSHYYDSKIITKSVIKIDNFNFMNPLKTASFTYILTLPSFTIDQTEGIVISRANSTFYPSSNTNLPSGYTGNYEQTLGYQSGTGRTATNISQQIFIGQGTYALSFWASGRSEGYVTSNVFSI